MVSQNKYKHVNEKDHHTQGTEQSLVKLRPLQKQIQLRSTQNLFRNINLKMWNVELLKWFWFYVYIQWFDYLWTRNRNGHKIVSNTSYKVT